MEKLGLIHGTYERQALLAKRVVEGKVKLPLKDEMMKDLEADLLRYKREFNAGKDAYYKFNKQYSAWDYNDELVSMSQMEEDPAYKQLRDIDVRMKQCVANGNYWSRKLLDFEQASKGYDFKPTSEKF